MQEYLFDKKTNVKQLQEISKNTMVEHLGIEFIEVGRDFIIAKMPVDHRTVQPMGLLHGGASVALAETLGSIASSMIVDINKHACVGLEINANHIKSANEGFVTGKASPIHLGRKTHVWDIKITDGNDRLICVSRLTVAIVEKQR